MSGPVDLHEISIELAARMIFLGKKADSLDEARELAQARSCWMARPIASSKKLSRRRAAIPRCSIASSCCPTQPALAKFSVRARAISAPSMRRISGCASTMIGAGRDRKEDVIDPAVGVILEVESRTEDRRRFRPVPHLLHA